MLNLTKSDQTQREREEKRQVRLIQRKETVVSKDANRIVADISDDENNEAKKSNEEREILKRSLTIVGVLHVTMNRTIVNHLDYNRIEKIANG